MTRTTTTAKKYRLSAETLGLLAGEHDGKPEPLVEANIELTVEGVGFVSVPRSGLDEVRKPLPAEPGPGPYLIGGIVCVRLPAGPLGCTWFVASPGDGPTYRWMDWADLWDRYGGGEDMVRLVPAHKPVSLPWSSPGLEQHIAAAPRVVIEASDYRSGQIHMRPSLAREKAAALVAAAEEAELLRG